MKTKSKRINRSRANRTPAAPKGQDKTAPDQGAAVSPPDQGAAGAEQKSKQGQNGDSAVPEVLEVYFKPPLAIARVGGSDTPLESFVWTEDPMIHGDRRTTLHPAVTLEVSPDGTARPYFPGAIHFKDGERLRPVAPFFELWVKLKTVEKGKPVIKDKPLTLCILKQLKIPLDSVMYRITVANRKAQRRTRRAADAFIARAEAAGNDHERKPLLAISPHNPQEEPLVFADRPVPLGHFQVIRPEVGKALAVDLSVLRVRFTPARGEVYGPPSAVTGPASPLKQGDALDPSTLGGRIYEIVPAENRILNPKSRWCDYAMDQQDQMDPTPSDSYDGANVGESRSWGVVDDTCDGIIEATVVVPGSKRYVARSRVLSSCPDFAPDRRTFLSFADDLADRDCDPLPEVDDKTIEDVEAEVGDLFARVSEFASLVNLDATRNNTILTNRADSNDVKEVEGLPRIFERTMTSEETHYKGDKKKKEPYADELVPLKKGRLRSPRGEGLQYADLAHEKHLQLADIEMLLDRMREDPERFRHLLRPPYGRFSELKRKPGQTPDPNFRDPRVTRDTVHDMRMPPYMRDSDATALSLTWRQYHEIRALVDRVSSSPRRESPGTRRREELLNILKQGPLNEGPKRKSDKILPRNLTARAADWVRGNPVVSRPEDAVANCFPGLELDERNLDRRFFPGLVFEFVMWDDDAKKKGARLAYVDYLEDPDLRDEDLADAENNRTKKMELFNQIDQAVDDLSETGARWFLEAIEQGGKKVQLAGLGGDVVWRLVRSLEAKEVTIHLRRRDRLPVRRQNGERTYKFTGWRRRFTDAMTGVISTAYQPGELLQSLCSPWQHDFRDCACHYWASNRPDVVYAEIPLGESLPGGLSKDSTRATTRFDWMRADRSSERAAGALLTMDENRPFQLNHFQINRAWQSLNVVLGDTEIGPLWSPPTPDNANANPFASPEELAKELHGLAAIEMALAFEYLYAMFSLRDPEDRNDKKLVEKYPDLPDDLTIVRHFLLSTATSEMQHLRWVNEILWKIRQAGLLPYGYYPALGIYDDDPLHFHAVLEPAFKIPTAKKIGKIWHMWKEDGTPRMRDRKLRPLTGPNPSVRDMSTPYLRPLEVRTWSEVGEETHELFKNIVNDLREAYKAAASGQLPELGTNVANARTKMQELLKKAEDKAKTGVGLPFFEDFPPPKDETKDNHDDKVPDALRDFIIVEHPLGFVDHSYARVVATLRKPEYPQDLVGYAQRIVRDGMVHESRFAEISFLLRSYWRD